MGSFEYMGCGSLGSCITDICLTDKVSFYAGVCYFFSASLLLRAIVCAITPVRCTRPSLTGRASVATQLFLLIRVDSALFQCPWMLNASYLSGLCTTPKVTQIHNHDAALVAGSSELANQNKSFHNTIGVGVSSLRIRVPHSLSRYL